MLLSWKKSLLEIYKILGLFINTSTANDKYFFLDRENFNTMNSDATI